MVVVTHAFNPSVQEAEIRISLCKLEASLVYRAGSRIARVTIEILFQNNKKV